MKHRLFCIGLWVCAVGSALGLTQEQWVGPTGSGEFGKFILVLQNGNVVVADPLFDRAGGIVDAGAVYLLRPDGSLINRIQGSTTGDKVGSAGLTLLRSGNFLVRSPDWDNGGTADAGAVTFGNAETGFDVGALSNITTSNSFVGGNTDDSVGGGGVVALTNGHYVVASTSWNGSFGSVTWGNGFRGTTGVVSATNSVVGSAVGDQVGSVYVSSTGQYWVIATRWRNGAAANAGAVRFCSGTGPTVGAISAANALVGTSTGDSVGIGGVYDVGEGNFVVLSPQWTNGGTANAGAATFVNGATGLTGPVTTANSLVGTTAGDQVGSMAFTLSNGHCFIGSQFWDNGPTVNVGALTWFNGFTGTVGTVSASNSWIGASANDGVGGSGSFEVGPGHLVLVTPNWDHGAIVDAGAVTWIGDVSAPTSGVVSAANSLHGTTASDKVGSSFFSTVVANGANYLVRSPDWDNGAVVDAGAVTWCDGKTGRTGPVSADNSLVGSSTQDSVGGDVLILPNGHYVTVTSSWDNGSVLNVGAVTWASGTKGIKGTISAANSLVGSTADDEVGSNTGAFASTTSNYLVMSPYWQRTAGVVVGAVTWADGSKALKGTVSAANSLVGTLNGDAVGGGGFMPDFFGDGYIIRSLGWNSGRGAVTWADRKSKITGEVSAKNSLVGASPGDMVGNSLGLFLENGDYMVMSSVFASTGAITLCRRDGGSVGVPDASNSIFGPAIGTSLSMTTTRGRIAFGRAADNKVYLLGSYFPTSLAKTGNPAPGATDIAYSTVGAASVDSTFGVMFDCQLTGAGSASGKNRAVFSAFADSVAPDLAMQNGDRVYVAPSVAIATVSSIGSPLNNQRGRGLFQITLNGANLTITNNRMLMVDTGAVVSPIFQTGQPMTLLQSAKISSIKELLQSDEGDLISLNYTLAASSTPAVNTSNDTGVLPLTHSGIQLSGNAREGMPAFGGGGTFGQFNTKGAVGYEVLHFSAALKPASGSTAEAIFRMNADGGSAARVALVGESPPDITGDPDAATVKYSSFPALSQHVGATSENVLFKAILKSGDSALNEGLWMLPHTDVPGDQRIIRKGDQITGLPTGVVLNSIQRFWPADDEQVMILGKISGPGVSTANNMVLLLRQEDGTQLLLMRTGETKAGLGNAKVKTISAVEVVNGSGTYAVLTTLSDTPSSRNQALWTGCTTLGAPSPANQAALRQPVVRLLKGERYSSSQTDSAVIKSISLKPLPDATGAGNRGLGRCQSTNGSVAVYLLIDRNVTELVMLPPVLAPL